MNYLIHCTNNADAASRGTEVATIDDVEFNGSLNELFNFVAWAMNECIGFPDEDDFRNDVKSGEWELRSDEEAKNDIDSADVGAGYAVVFWVKDSHGRTVLDTGIDESDWMPEEDGDDEDWEVDDEEEQEEPWTGGDFEIKDGVLVKYHGEDGEVVIPDEVTIIGYTAFRGCEDLTSVTIPEGVTDIKSDAFFGCSGLTSVTIPSSATSIGWDAFYGCDNLNSVMIPSSVTSIGFSAFGGCTKLADVKILNPKLFKEVVKNPDKSFKDTPWAEKVKFGLVKENRMKKMNENTKVTLTLNQLRGLIRESKIYEDAKTLELKAVDGLNFVFASAADAGKISQDYTVVRTGSSNRTPDIAASITTKDGKTISSCIEVKNINSFALCGFRVDLGTARTIVPRVGRSVRDDNPDEPMAISSVTYKDNICKLVNDKLQDRKYDMFWRMASDNGWFFPNGPQYKKTYKSIRKYIDMFGDGYDIIHKIRIRLGRDIVYQYFHDHFTSRVDYINIGTEDNSQLYLIDPNENPFDLCAQDQTELPDFLSNFRPYIRFRFKPDASGELDLYVEVIVEPIITGNASLVDNARLPEVGR